MHIIFWIIVGIIAGALAKMVVPAGNAPGGLDRRFNHRLNWSAHRWLCFPSHYRPLLRWLDWKHRSRFRGSSHTAIYHTPLYPRPHFQLQLVSLRFELSLPSILKEGFFFVFALIITRF